MVSKAFDRLLVGSKLLISLTVDPIFVRSRVFVRLDLTAGMSTIVVTLVSGTLERFSCPL